MCGVIFLCIYFSSFFLVHIHICSFDVLIDNIVKLLNFIIENNCYNYLWNFFGYFGSWIWV